SLLRGGCAVGNCAATRPRRTGTPPSTRPTAPPVHRWEPSSLLLRARPCGPRGAASSLKRRRELAMDATGTSASQTYIGKEARYGARNYAPVPVVVDHAKDCLVWDVEGREYIDM